MDTPGCVGPDGLSDGGQVQALGINPDIKHSWTRDLTPTPANIDMDLTAQPVGYAAKREWTRPAPPSVVAKRIWACLAALLQATVTVDGRHSPATSDAGGEDDGEGGPMCDGGASSAFMCTPQSFPPTPVSRAHVMARTSQFADDILFLARDQLRLRENLKPGVDETVRVHVAMAVVVGSAVDVFVFWWCGGGGSVVLEGERNGGAFAKRHAKVRNRFCKRDEI